MYKKLLLAWLVAGVMLFLSVPVLAGKDCDSFDAAIRSKLAKGGRSLTVCNNPVSSGEDFTAILQRHISECHELMSRGWKLVESRQRYLQSFQDSQPEFMSTLRYYNEPYKIRLITRPRMISQETLDEALRLHILASYVFSQQRWMLWEPCPARAKIVLELEEREAYVSRRMFFVLTAYWYMGEEKDLFQKDKYRGEDFPDFFRTVLDKALNDFFH